MSRQLQMSVKSKTGIQWNEEEELLNQRKRQEEQMQEIKQQIRGDFARETQKDPYLEDGQQLTNPLFSRELHTIQSFNQRLKAQLSKEQNNLESKKMSTISQDDQSQISEETRADDQISSGQLFYTFSKKSYASTTFGFFPLRSEGNQKEMKEKLNGLSEQSKLIEQFLQAEEKNHESLMSILVNTKKEYQSLKNLVETEERQLRHLMKQDEDAIFIEQQATEIKREAQNVLTRGRSEIKKLEETEERYKEKKRKILEELRKDNNFYENTLAKIKIQITEKQKINQELDKQLKDLNIQEEQRQNKIKEQWRATELIEIMHKLEQYFLDGQIYRNPEDIQELVDLEQEEQERQKRAKSISPEQGNNRKRVFSQQRLDIKLHKGKQQNTFLTAVETEQQQNQENVSIKQKKTNQSPVRSIRKLKKEFTRIDSINFYKLIETFFMNCSDGLNSFVDQLIQEFRELKNENGVLEKIYTFQTKQVEINTQVLKDLSEEAEKVIYKNSFVEDQVKPETKLDEIKMDMLNNQVIALDSGLMDVQTFKGYSTINLLIRNKLDQDVKKQHLIDRRNDCQRFAFYLYLNMLEYNSKLCEMLKHIQEITFLVPTDFEKQYSTVYVRMNHLRLQLSHKLRQPQKSITQVQTPVPSSDENFFASGFNQNNSSFLISPLDTPQAATNNIPILSEFSFDQLINKMKEMIIQLLKELQCKGQVLKECIPLIDESIDNIKNDYVCKAFTDKERVTRCVNIIDRRLREKHNQEYKTDFIIDIIHQEFDNMHIEIHNHQQDNIKTLLNVCINLIKQLRKFRKQLSIQLLGKDVEQQKEIQISSQVVYNYMKKATNKLLSDYLEVKLEQENFKIDHRIDQNIVQINKSTLDNTKSFIKDLQTLSRVSRKVPDQFSTLLKNTSPSSVKFFSQEKITEPQIQNENENLDYQRNQLKNQIEINLKSDDKKAEPIDYASEKRKHLFTRLNNDQSHKRLLQNEKEHLRELFKTNEILFKIKALEMKTKKLQKDDFLNELTQNRISKEKLFYKEFKMHDTNKFDNQNKQRFHLELGTDIDDDLLSNPLNPIHGSNLNISKKLVSTKNIISNHKGSSQQSIVKSSHSQNIERPVTQVSIRKNILPSKEEVNEPIVMDMNVEVNDYVKVNDQKKSRAKNSSPLRPLKKQHQKKSQVEMPPIKPEKFKPTKSPYATTFISDKQYSSILKPYLKPDHQHAKSEINGISE